MFLRLTMVVLFFSFNLVCFSHPALGAAAPEGIDGVLEQMGELEESFEGGEWQEAQESFEKIDKIVKGILAQAQIEDKPLLNSLKDLKKYIGAQNEYKVEVNYIRFQKQFFQFIDQFDFDVNPILVMIKQYVVEESTEAYEKKDYEDVISEMREAGNLIDHARELFMEKGIPEQEIDSFKSTVIELIMTGKKKEYEKMGELLEKVKLQYESFLSRYNNS